MALWLLSKLTAGHPQGVGDPVDDPASAAAQHFAAANPQVRTETQPGSKMFFRRKPAQVRPHFGQKDQLRQHSDAFDGGQIHSQLGIKRGAHVLSDHFVVVRFSSFFAGRQRLVLHIHPVGQPGCFGDNLLVTGVNFCIVSVIEFKGCFEDKQMLGPVITCQCLLDRQRAGLDTAIHHFRERHRVALPIQNGRDDL